jgi:hypothetical protein
VSDTPRVVLAVEGPTDTIVLRAILRTVLEDFELIVAQPESTNLGSNYGPDGGGWKGVRGWCQGVAQSGGTASSPVFQNADLVIVHLDADVSDDPEITCRQPKSVGSRPYEPTTDSLRSLVAQWLGGAHQKLVICIPHLETETWLLPIFRTAVTNPEDHSNPLQEFASGTPKFCDANYKKQRTRYEGVSELITQGWAITVAACPEAFFFNAELRAAL